MVIVNVRVEAAAAAVGSGTCNIVAQNQLVSVDIASSSAVAAAVASYWQARSLLAGT